MKRVLITLSAATAMLTLPGIAAFAAGPYDGTWQVEAQPAGQSTVVTQSSGCSGWRLQFTVKDNQIQGSLARSSYGGGVSQGGGRGSTPITGTVQSDGTLNAHWQNITATGKLTGDKAELRWRGTCGPRVATGGRVASSGSSSQ